MVCPYTSYLDWSLQCGTRADLDLVGGGGGCSCMLLVQPTPTCTDAGPDLLQLALAVSFHILHVCSILYIHVTWKLMECVYLCLLGTYVVRLMLQYIY